MSQRFRAYHRVMWNRINGRICRTRLHNQLTTASSTNAPGFGLAAGTCREADSAAWQRSRLGPGPRRVKLHCALKPSTCSTIPIFDHPVNASVGSPSIISTVIRHAENFLAMLPNPVKEFLRCVSSSDETL